MRDPGPLKAGEPARGLAERLRSATARPLRWFGRRVPGTAGADAQFTAHVEQALQIVQEVSAPRLVALPGDRATRVRIRR
jgi:hypothetical protein